MATTPATELDMTVYRAHVRELECPLCGAGANQNCRRPGFDGQGAEVEYVHDERSAAHYQARVAAAMERLDELESLTAQQADPPAEEA